MLILSALTAVGLGVVLYFASTSLAWFATSPTTDPHFGALNHCLMKHVPIGRAGWAVSQDGRRAAAFDDRGVAVCSSEGTGRFVPLRGITRAAWDHAGTLWLSASGLFRISDGEEGPQHVGEIASVALVGHGAGVTSLDASGRLVSFGREGSGLGFFELPARADSRVELAVDAEGELVSVVMRGGVWILRARDLSLVRAESPCDAQYLWWLPQPGKALIACDPDESWALRYEAATGAREAASKRERVRAALVPGAGLYVRSCEGLPCTAATPYQQLR